MKASAFAYARVTSVDRALELLAAHGEKAKVLSGGQSLMPAMNLRLIAPELVVDIGGLNELRGIVVRRDVLRIGALTRHVDLLNSSEIAAHAPLLAEAVTHVAHPAIRNRGTLGGSLAHADPHMDMPPVLIALGAQVVAASPAGERTIPVETLFAGYYETVLARNELITSVIIPAQGARRAAYLKCTTRAVHDWPALGVAVALESDGTTVRDAHVVVSAATETPTRLDGAEQALRGGTAGDALWRQAGEAAAAEAETISDGQGSAAYKRQLVRVYVARALAAALK